MISKFYDTEFWFSPLDGHTIAHLVAEKLIKHRNTGNTEMYNSVQRLMRACMK